MLSPDVVMQADGIKVVKMILTGIVVVTRDFISEEKASTQFMKAAL